MIKQILTGLALIMTLIAGAQRVTAKTDKLTGDTLFTTSAVKLYSKAPFMGSPGEEVQMSFTRNKNNTTLSLLAQTGRSSKVGMVKGTQLNIKFEGGAIVTLPAAGYSNSNDKAGGYASSFTGFFLIPEENLSMFKDKMIVFFRLSSYAGNLDYDIKSKNAKNVMKAVQLIYK